MSRRGRGAGNCFNCGGAGHMARDCPSNPGAAGGGVKRALVCYLCGQEGHPQRLCPSAAPPVRGVRGGRGGRGIARGVVRGRGRGRGRGGVRGRGRGVKRAPVTAESLDADMDKYWEQSEPHAKARLDTDLDTYFETTPGEEVVADAPVEEGAEIVEETVEEEVEENAEEEETVTNDEGVKKKVKA